MGDDVMVGLGAIVVLGVGMQWLARRLRVPAILLLIAAGLVAGPWLGVIDPDEIFGDSLFTIVSMAVSLLLFEGGLGLDIKELRRRGPRPVVQLVTIGVAVTCLAGTVAAGLLFDLPTNLCLPLGALLVVSGPTVVGPLLNVVRPREPTATILRWEGIVIDPIGATLALVVLKLVTADDAPFAELLLTALVGCGVGMAAAGLLVIALRTFSVPDDLEPAVTFMVVIAAYTVGEWIFEEGGLFAATVLGVALANQRWVSVRRIAAFGHDVGVLVLGGLFVVLAARVTPSDFVGIVGPSIALSAVLMLLVRPVVGWLCTTRSGLPWRDRAFIGALAPRGIVAAATSALFALRLTDAGIDDGRIDAIVFVVIVATCLVYGLGSAPLARALGVAEPEPTGILLVGHQPWLLGLADLMADRGEVVTVLASEQHQLEGTDRRWRLLTMAATDHRVVDELRSVRTAVLASHDAEHNALLLARCLEVLSRREIFVLPADDAPTSGRRVLRDLARGGPADDGPLSGPNEPIDPFAPTDPLDELVAPGDLEEVEAGLLPASASGWERRPFSPGCTQSSLAAAYDEGGLRVLAGPDVDPGRGEVAMVAWHRDGHIDMAPTPHSLREASTVAVVGGRPVRDSRP